MHEYVMGFAKVPRILATGRRNEQREADGNKAG
jgi:hypothetical protein